MVTYAKTYVCEEFRGGHGEGPLLNFKEALANYLQQKKAEPVPGSAWFQCRPAEQWNKEFGELINSVIILHLQKQNLRTQGKTTVILADIAIIKSNISLGTEHHDWTRFALICLSL